MSENEIHETNDTLNEDNGLALARKMAEEEEGIGRRPKGPSRYIIPTVAVIWSFFQLSIASWLILDSTFIRAIHLGFAILIVFLNYPLFKKPRFGLKFLSASDTIPIMDYVIAIMAAFTALYIMIDYAGITTRYGAPILRDVIVGIALTVFLLEASRRVIGPALPIIALLFCCYAFFGPYMPDVIAFKGVSMNRFVGQMSMSTEGIYGIPLDVSATIVFLFVLFGAMMDKAGAGHYFIQLALSLLGGFKGGPAKAAIVGSGLTGMVSGSSIANIVTTGTFTIPMMKKVGYPPTKAAAVEVAASTDGQLAPPIMGAAAFIIAEYVNVPYIQVVKAAIIPAFASYAALFFITHIEASKLGLKGLSRAELPLFFKTLIGGVHFLIPIGMLLYELIIARHSPELAAFHAIWVMAALMLFQGPVKAYLNKQPIRPAFRQSIIDIFSSLATGARNMVAVALATAAAGIIVGVVALGLGGLITEIIDIISMGNIYLMLVITAFASLLIGMGLPTTATYIVMASLTAPAIVTIAGYQEWLVPLMSAHLFCFYFGILADDTPPVGLAAYAAAAIAKSPPIPTGLQGFMYDIRTAILPFMFIFNSDLILHNINSWFQGILIFLMACIGNFAFASATQGWFVARNRFYEVPLFLSVTFMLMRPDAVSSWIGIAHDQRYWVYPIGLAMYGMIYLMQRVRIPKTAAGLAQ
ncbi:MAG: TRAP transporter permease [Desulfobacterales bacterium]|jgi:TRAP transporter 4TM/12TM fusion protein|nr:TRAP transporter permease [Desulfobacterales bacterium]MDP6683467.1 TRAP transporter permease [Desulfobacterales bacterium]MDP6807293.1 TRAP transporter permease [Desulfobacterales bacterium]|tara:strand:+ start:9990 stop:12080 length:2091 start_codon:yes stop_codon:yes gene_type:complete